jgi:adenosylcobinamide-GDP ribazoletransferase
VGAAIGLAVGGVWWLAQHAWPAAAGAAVTLACDVGLTGYLHLDGLADAADGLLPPLTRERRLAVMADPAVGAFGAVTLVAVLVLRFAAFASTPAAPLVVGALWCGARTAMAVIARSLPYAHPEGMAAAFLSEEDGRPRRGVGAALGPGVTGIVLVLALAVVGGGGHGVAAVGAEGVGIGAVVALGLRRLGGFTGDVLGAAGVVGETLGLLVLAAKW